MRREVEMENKLPYVQNRSLSNANDAASSVFITTISISWDLGLDVIYALAMQGLIV